jgi:hypothetical protein
VPGAATPERSLPRRHARDTGPVISAGQRHHGAPGGQSRRVAQALPTSNDSPTWPAFSTLAAAH